MTFMRAPPGWVVYLSLFGGASALAWFVLHQRQKLERQKSLQRRLDHQLCYGRPGTHTLVVNSEEDWSRIAPNVLSTVDATRMVGLDCEWITHAKYTGKVALLQLALADGTCILLRLCQLDRIPDSLRQMLERYDVLKLGVAVKEDGKKLFADYGVAVNGTVDLRYLVLRHCPGYKSKMGLQALTEHFLGLKLNKDWRLRCSSWEDETLNEAHIEYASNDAFVSINIALALAIPVREQQFLRTEMSENEFEDLILFTRSLCLPYAGVNYKSKYSERLAMDNTRSKSNSIQRPVSIKPKARNKHCVRKTPLYHNAYLEAPDGAALCVCDTKKALWYIEKGLGELIEEDPLRVRLKFEPSGRPEGPAGEYYLTVKDNVCVVCGKNDSYLRKYIVPHEYRKFFPEVMRDHQSHDVLLMCTVCHQLSNLHDMTMRRVLAEKCNAPIGSEDDIKYHELAEVKTVRSAARAILKDQALNKIPEDRMTELKLCIKNYFKVEEITQELLVNAANSDTNVINDNYAPHGKRVVDFYVENEGIIPLERLWRQNFLDKMQPKFLPPLWSVDHQKLRLDVRAAENRIDPDDYIIANEGKNHLSSM